MGSTGQQGMLTINAMHEHLDEGAMAGEQPLESVLSSALAVLCFHRGRGQRKQGGGCQFLPSIPEWLGSPLQNTVENRLSVGAYLSSMRFCLEMGNRLFDPS